MHSRVNAAAGYREVKAHEHFPEAQGSLLFFFSILVYIAWNLPCETGAHSSSRCKV